MDKYERRRLQLMELLKTRCSGKKSVLAKKIEKEPSYVSRILYPEGKAGKKRIADDLIEAIEKGFQLPHGWLDTEHPVPNLPTQGVEEAASIYNVTPIQNVDRDKIHVKGTVPLISWVSAGYFCEVIDNFHPGDAEEWISTTVSVGPNAYALRVRGDSMEPDFPEGSIIIVDPRREPQPGNYVIAKNGGEATFKQLTKDGADRYLKPLNPQYPIKLIDEHMIICGVVVSMERKLV